MSANHNTEDVIASALALSTEERLAVIDAIHVSLADPSIDHGPREPASDGQAAWKDEIARRVNDVKSGRITTVPAEEAERMIRGDVPPFRLNTILMPSPNVTGQNCRLRVT